MIFLLDPGFEEMDQREDTQDDPQKQRKKTGPWIIDGPDGISSRLLQEQARKKNPQEIAHPLSHDDPLPLPVSTETGDLRFGRLDRLQETIEHLHIIIEELLEILPCKETL